MDINLFIADLKNKFDFLVRNHLSLSRKNYSEKNEVKKQTNNPQRESELILKYELDELKNNSTNQNYLENLYILDIFDKNLETEKKDSLQILDIGSKNWFYAKGEHAFFNKNNKNIELTGIEIDANRLYSNFFSRAEVVKFYTKDLKNTKYIHDDFLNHKGEYDYIIWLFPFIFEYPQIKWGIPLSHFKPKEMLKHAYDSLKENGQLFILNQGEDEYTQQKMLCEELKIPFTQKGEITSDFLSFENKRYLTIIKKS